MSGVKLCSQSVLSQHLEWHPTNTLSTSPWTLDQQSVCLPSVEWLLCINQHSMTCLQKLLDFWPTVHWDVDRVLTEVSIEYRSRVDPGYWFRVSINTWPRTLWVHVIQLLCALLPSNWTLLKIQKLQVPLSELSYLLIMRSYFLLIRFAGQVGFVVCGIRNSKDAQIGDTFFHPHAPVEPLKGFKPMRPMVRSILKSARHPPK